jgi:hypothetical protein
MHPNGQIPAYEFGFYYDHLHVDGHFLPLKLRSLVGLIPLISCLSSLGTDPSPSGLI